MNIEQEKNEVLSTQILDKKEPSQCNKKINKYVKFPTMTIEKIIRAIILIGGTIFMIISCFTGVSYSRYDVDCLNDLTQIYTSTINDFFLKSETFNIVLKFIFSLIIDLLIIYTLLVWSLFSRNVRLLSTGISYMILNILMRFAHIQKQPENSAFTMNHIFSIFVNYQISTYSFYSVVAGLLVICAFEWRRNNNQKMFWIILVTFFLESFIMISMKGNYFHEIFSGGIIGHYLFMMNEKILTLIFGEEYLSLNIESNKGKINQSITSEKTMENSENTENKENEEISE